MLVLMLSSAAGPNGVWLATSTYQIPDEIAAELIAGGYAVSREIEQREQPDITSREMAINPKAATRGTRRRI